MLFSLWDGKTRVPSGWTRSAAKFEVEWPKDPSVVRSHFDAHRKAYNWALAQVKIDLDAKKANPAHAGVAWTLGALRKRWNKEKAMLPRGGRRAQRSATARGSPTWWKPWTTRRSREAVGVRVARPVSQGASPSAGVTPVGCALALGLGASKTRPQGKVRRGEARTEPDNRQAKKLERNASGRVPAPCTAASRSATSAQPELCPQLHGDSSRRRQSSSTSSIADSSAITGSSSGSCPSCHGGSGNMDRPCARHELSLGTRRKLRRAVIT